MKVRNTFIIFLVSGFWHGANWTFIVWGGLNALYFLPLLLLKRNRTNLGVVAEGRMLPNLRELWQMGTTFLLTVLAWVFFRAESLSVANSYLTIMANTFLQMPQLKGLNQLWDLLILFCFIGFFIFIEWIGRSEKFSLLRIMSQDNSVKNISIYIIVFSLIVLMASNENDFIYFQF